MTIKSLFVTLALFAYCFSGFSQGGICGTSVSIAQVSLEKTIPIITLNATQSLPQINRDLSLAIYVVKDSNNNVGISPENISAAILKLNSYFNPISLKFHICNTVYIDNYQFDNLTQDKNEKDLTTLYSTPYVVNVYLTGKINDRYKNSVKGFTYMPADGKNFIFITKEFFNTSEVGHQFGHFFNLYHTHETIFGNEPVNNTSVCGTTGDLCCDTEADPKLADFVDKCSYTGKFKDSNNQFYNPSVKNIMSFSQDDCRCFYSKIQYLRVIYALNHFKNTLK